YGINSINSPANISYNRFNLNEKGIQLYGIGSANPATVTVDYNLIEYSTHNGILVSQNSNGIIEHNEIRYNGTGPQYRGAIQLGNQSAGGSCSPLIQYNHIHHNFKQGITAWDILGVNAIQPEILNNLIEYNLTGIYLLNSSGYVADNVIRHNFIPGDANSGAGVMVAGATSQPYFERNEIHGNYTGFYIGDNAQPCLGNLDIYHAWAQGENQIYANIDGTNTLHSVYTYSYTNPNIIIRAENNYWGTNDPAEIALGINDQNDNPALPLVDFEPFLTGQLDTSVIGSVAYYGGLALANHRIQFVGADTGDILFEFPIAPDQQFDFSLPLSEPFHVVALADVAGTARTLYGAAGGLSQPSSFAPGDFVPVDLGLIGIEDVLPPRYQESGPSELIGSRVCFPIRNRFFVYRWEYINWLYEEGDYLFIRRHERYHPDGNLIFNLPDGTTWDKISDIGHNDAWIRTEILDDAGTSRQSVFRCKKVTDDAPVAGNGPKQVHDLIFQTDASTLQTISIRMLTPDIRRLYHYADGFVWRAEDISTNAGDPYLQENIWWEYHPIPPAYQPTNLCVDFVEHYLNNPSSLTLYWQAPMDDGIHDWTTYRIYNFDQLYAEVPFSQQYWHTDEFFFHDSYQFTVRAYDGTNESAPTNGVWVTWVSANDPAATPPALSIQPNPASLSRDGGLEVMIKSGKALEGRIDIHNLRGQLVRSIPLSSPGDLSWRWDLRDAKGSLCSSGIYFLKLLLDGEQVQTRRTVLLK
ncbi:MAG: right-handed parallel beta-helix repeat-containing protein, partial [Candidatus Syntrophosphaera sp.]|nr:right-handed parallel beta-helix repeat-containing protein [Candidatus Syntrophosphaera sp.]